MNLYEYFSFDVEHAYEVKLFSCPQLWSCICIIVLEHINWISGLNETEDVLQEYLPLMQ